MPKYFKKASFINLHNSKISKKTRNQQHKILPKLHERACQIRIRRVFFVEIKLYQSTKSIQLVQTLDEFGKLGGFVNKFRDKL